MKRIKNHIIIDQFDTWPQSVISLLNENKKGLLEFLGYEKKVVLEPDFIKRIKNPPNPYQEIWDETILELNNSLQDKKLLGIHCTKLMDYEIDEMKKLGLVPLKKDFALKRVRRLYRKGLIDKSLLTEIENKKELAAKNRSGMTFCFHNLSTLRFKSGIEDFFKFWGGEAIYMYLNNPKPLKHIGTPCIILLSFNINELKLDLAERMICIYFDDNHRPHDTDSIFRIKLEVIDIIRKGDSLFNHLTNIDSWDMN